MACSNCGLRYRASLFIGYVNGYLEQCPKDIGTFCPRDAMADSLLSVATPFQSELRQYGLQPTELEADEADADGWWTPVAKWARNRPHIGIYFDRLLGDGQRHFWFGFYSTATQIRWLSERVPKDIQNWASVTDRDLDQDGRLNEEARARVHNANGLA
jgi:hypothetical protein